MAYKLRKKPTNFNTTHDLLGRDVKPSTGYSTFDSLTMLEPHRHDVPMHTASYMVGLASEILLDWFLGAMEETSLTDNPANNDHTQKFSLVDKPIKPLQVSPIGSPLCDHNYV